MSSKRTTRRTTPGPSPINADRRRARKLRDLPPDAACAWCGMTTPEALILAKRSLLELDHASGKANDPDLLVPLCKNCHAVRTAHQHDQRVDLDHGDGRSVLARQAGALQSQAAFFRDLADAQERHAEQLVALERALDRERPGWRALPEAHG